MTPHLAATTVAVTRHRDAVRRLRDADARSRHRRRSASPEVRAHDGFQLGTAAGTNVT
jgi:hypothetical protein